MWLLENDDNALNGKKVWLQPGKKFVFGRTPPQGNEVVEVEQLFIVVHKTISRKHLMIEIDPVQPNECGNPRGRSRLTVTDLETKIGTLLDGVQIRGTSHILVNDQHELQLGKFPPLFRFTWVPVVFTFSFTSKEKKAKPYHTLYDRLGPLDIKVLDEYKRGITTHVVAKKRNTPKGLQALIDGKYIVHNDTFVNAVIAAAFPGENGSAPLEEDFTANWPDEQQFLPPRGEEPTVRGDEAYAPNPERQDMFDGYTFIFYDQKQFENLHAPISGGRGKALYREVIPNDTTVDDFVRYVKTTAGEKGLGEFEDGSVGKGVVVVRFNPVGGEAVEWFADFGRQVALKLDQRLIEQNEFLDVILGSDASIIRRPLDFASTEVPSATSELPQSFQTTPAPTSEPVSTPAMEEMPPPDSSRRARSRRAARGQFRGFLEDDFSGPSVLHSVPESMEVDSTPAPVEEPESQGLFVSQDPEIQVQREESQPRIQATTRSSRKRPASPISEDEDVMEVMAPTTAAIKRRRLADELDRKRRGESTPPPPPPPVIKESPKATAPLKPPAKAPAKRSRKTKEPSPDMLEESRREREEAEHLAEEERLALAAQDIDPSEIRAKLIIEDFAIGRTVPPPRRVAHADESDRWDERWNGKRNFKGFRRRGADNSVRRVEKVIVALEEIKMRNYGIGDEFWEAERDGRGGGGGSGKKGKEKAETQDSGSGMHVRGVTGRNEPPGPEPDSENDGERPGRASQRQISILSDSNSDFEILPSAPPPRATTTSQSQRASRTTKSATQPSAGPSKSLRNLSLEPSSSSATTAAAGKKRAAAAAGVTSKPPPAKKPKQQLVIAKSGGVGRRGEEDEEDEEESSDDGLRFKFKRKR